MKDLGLAIGFSLVAMTAIAQDSKPVPVTVDNFIRAETDLYFTGVAVKEGGFGKFEHHRELASIDAQNIIRMNREIVRCRGWRNVDFAVLRDYRPDTSSQEVVFFTVLTTM